MTEQNNNYNQQTQGSVNPQNEYIPDPADVEKNKIIAGLSYILFFLPLIACPESKFGRFHANQGLLLLIIGVGGGIALSILQFILSIVLFFIIWQILSLFTLIYSVFWIGVTVFAVLGFINAYKGTAKKLPLFGQFKIIK